LVHRASAAVATGTAIATPIFGPPSEKALYYKEEIADGGKIL